MKTLRIISISLFIIFLFYTNTIFSQEQFATFNFGRSYNGTGDLGGFQYGISYGKNINQKRLFWTVGFEGTLHDDESIEYFFTDEQGNNLDGKSRFVSAGLQLVGSLGYDFIKSDRHRFGASVGPLLRYQSSSIPDVISTFFPIITDLPFPVQVIEFREPFRTLALGAVLKVNYR